MIKKILHRFMNPTSRIKPIYFVTFHKTASSYFGKYILKQVVNLNHQDIALDIFNNKVEESYDLELPNTIYGPVRLSLEGGPVYKKFVGPLLEQNILKKHQAICFIRDPRDIIVSFFYSEAYSHAISRNDDIKSTQLQSRKYALEIGIDQYAIEKTISLKSKFEIMIDILKNNDNAILLRYEDMVYDYNNFYNKINKFIQLPEESRRIIFENTRPKKKGKQDHRRNGEQGSYKNELKPETIEQVNNELKEIIDFFGYS